MNKQHALVVDDDSYVRDATARALRLRGFEVHTAMNGREALDLLNKQEFVPVAIVSDHDMPLVSGSELYRLICQVHPALECRFILMTGNDRYKRFADEYAIPFLSKPFSNEQLDAAVKSVLP